MALKNKKNTYIIYLPVFEKNGEVDYNYVDYNYVDYNLTQEPDGSDLIDGWSYKPFKIVPFIKGEK